MKNSQPNFRQLAVDLTRLLRATRSQTTLNRKLGYKSNQIHRWESGQRRVPWSKFVDLCAVCRCDISRILADIAIFTAQPERWDLLAQHLLMGQAFKDVLQILGISYYTLRRWQNGESEPSADEVFALLALQADRLEAFVNGLAANGRFVVPASLGHSPANAVDVLFQFHMAGALTAALELDTYQSLERHDSGWLAEQLGVDARKVEDCLAALEKTGFVAWDSRHFRAVDKVIDTSGFDPRARILLRAYWYERFIAAIHSDQLKMGGKTKLSYFVHALSNEARQAIHDRLRLLYLDIDRIIRDDRASKKDGVFYLGIDLIDLTELRAPHRHGD